MMSSNYYRNQNRIKVTISNFFKTNKVLIIISLALFVFFFFVGVFTVGKHRSDLEIENLFNKYLLNFLNGDKTWLNLFFAFFLISIIASLVISLLSFSSFFIVLDLIMLSFYSYLAGFDIAIFVISFTFFGVINVMICIVPFFLSITMLFIFLICLKARRCKDIKKFGKFNCSNSGYAKYCLITIVIIGLLEFLMCLLLLFTKITIIT